MPLSSSVKEGPATLTFKQSYAVKKLLMELLWIFLYPTVKILYVDTAR
jgi:hypothetical protein